MEMADKKIGLSVIIPAYNLDKYLGRCLDSILNQGIEDMEIIVVDAGSTDGTRQVIKEYAGKYPQIKPIYSDVNLWASVARNKAINVTKGEYLAFCDADDTIPDGAYKELLRVAYQDNADIVTGNYTRRYRDGIRTPAIYRSPTGIERCFESCNVSFCNKLLKRKFVGDVRFPEDLKTAEDALFTLELYKKGPSVSCIDQFVYVYTIEKVEEEENNKHDHLYSPRDSFNDCMIVLRRTFEEPFEKWNKLWARFFLEYCGFAYQHIWPSIIDPDEKKAAFDALRNTMIYLQEKNPVCDFRRNGLAGAFASTYYVDYATFQTLSYEQYLLALLIARQNAPVASNIPDSFVNMCCHGEVGMRVIMRGMKGWVHYKLKR
jgi:glycosyltransferase involved in cell wall biosynthesis